MTDSHKAEGAADAARSLYAEECRKACGYPHDHGDQEYCDRFDRALRAAEARGRLTERNRLRLAVARLVHHGCCVECAALLAYGEHQPACRVGELLAALAGDAGAAPAQQQKDDQHGPAAQAEKLRGVCEVCLCVIGGREDYLAGEAVEFRDKAFCWIQHRGGSHGHRCASGSPAAGPSEKSAAQGKQEGAAAQAVEHRGTDPWELLVRARAVMDGAECLACHRDDEHEDECVAADIDDALARHAASVQPRAAPSPDSPLGEQEGTE